MHGAPLNEAALCEALAVSGAWLLFAGVSACKGMRFGVWIPNYRNHRLRYVQQLGLGSCALTSRSWGSGLFQQMNLDLHLYGCEGCLEFVGKPVSDTVDWRSENWSGFKQTPAIRPEWLPK